MYINKTNNLFMYVFIYVFIKASIILTNVFLSKYFKAIK